MTRYTRSVVVLLVALVQAACGDLPSSSPDASEGLQRRRSANGVLDVRIYEINNVGTSLGGHIFQAYTTCTFVAQVIRNGQVVPWNEYASILWGTNAGFGHSPTQDVHFSQDIYHDQINVHVIDIHGNSGSSVESLNVHSNWANTYCAG